MMDELEQLEIYSNEIAPLEEMVSKLEAENNQLLAELARIKQVVEKIHRATNTVALSAWAMMAGPCRKVNKS